MGFFEWTDAMTREPSFLLSALALAGLLFTVLTVISVFG